MVTLEDLKKIKDIEITKHDIPEWGGAIYLRGLTGRERDEFDQAVSEMDPDTVSTRKMMALLIAYSMCNEQGVRECKDIGEGVEVISDLPHTSIEKVFLQCKMISGFGPQADEDTEGNLESGQNEDT